MLKTKIKYVTIGTLIGAALTGTAAVASGNLTNIQVSLNPVSIEMNGKSVKDLATQSYHNGKEKVPYSIVYKGTTYVPLRFFSESLGFEVNWEDKSRKISLNQAEGPTVHPPLPGNDQNQGIVAGSVEGKVSFDGNQTFTYVVKNQTEKVQTIGLGGQEFEYIIRDENGKEVKKYSDGKMFTMIYMEKVLKQGEELTFETKVDDLPQGKYSIEFWLNSKGWENQTKVKMDFEIK